MKKHFSIRIENEILSKIDQIAADEDRSRGAVLRRIIQQFFFKGGEKMSNQKNALFQALQLIDQATHALTEARRLIGSVRPEAEKKGSLPEAEAPVPEWREKDYL